MKTPQGMEITERCHDCKLRSSRFFCGLPPANLTALEAVKFTTGYPEGAVLFMEGQLPRGVMILCKGRVKLSMTSVEGKAMILRIVKHGEVLGLHAAISGDPYQSTAETLEPCQVNFIRREDFLTFLRNNGEASIRAAQQLSCDYHTACEQVRSLGLAHSVPEKLARFLLDWATNGQEPKSGTRMKLTLTHEEIGQMIGTSRETVTRSLSEFRAKKLAVLNGSTLFIQNKEGLENLVNA
jgi:CRP/FNR family transcriptional regulator, cyclic AMP receptor protein